MSSPGTAQHQLPKDLGYTGDNEAGYEVTGSGTATTTLTEWKPYIKVNLGASSTAVLKLAKSDVWANKQTRIVVIKTAGTGQMQLVDSAGNDLLGDNFSAVGDGAIIENIGGLTLAKIWEQTT